MSEPTTDNAPSRFTLESLIGQTLDDRYVVDEMIGLGAMGAVFRGRHLRLRRTVALKVPRPELSTKAGFLGRFEREALTMAKLVQENIVQVFDVYISENPEIPSFIAMEYIEGVELEQYLFSQDNKLTVSAVMDLFFQIARGLDAAHERGIIHRDIKPKNICVTLPQRVAKIMDFGVAKLEMEDVYETVAEAAIGTPAYMAPEQITGDSLTPAADIYGLAMTLYHCLTRKLPFEAQSASNMLFAHVSSAPIAAHVRNPSLPIKVHKALAPALAKNPKDRPKTARALVLAVYQALEHLSNRSFGDLFSGALDATQTPRKEALEGEATVVDLPAMPWLKMTTQTRKYAILGGAGGILLLFILIFSFSGRSKKKVSEGVRSGSGPRGKELVEAAAVPTPLPPLEKPESAPPPPPTPVITATETPADQPLPVTDGRLLAADGMSSPSAAKNEPEIASAPAPATAPAEPADKTPPTGSGSGTEPVEPAALPPTPTPNPPPASSPMKKETQIADAKPDPKPAAKPDPKPEPDRGAPEKPKDVAVAEKGVDEKSYSEIDAARWDPKLSPMEPAAWKREQTRISIEKFFESLIEKPVFRGEFDAKRNALARTGGSTATTLLGKLDELSKTNTQIALSFQILDGGKYWSDRAEMRVEVKATGHPSDSPDPNSRKVLLKFSNPVPVRVQKVGDSWALLSFNNH